MMHTGEGKDDALLRDRTDEEVSPRDAGGSKEIADDSLGKRRKPNKNNHLDGLASFDEAIKVL
jgi:hypothetical protein